MVDWRFGKRVFILQLVAIKSGSLKQPTLITNRAQFCMFWLYCIANMNQYDSTRFQFDSGDKRISKMTFNPSQQLTYHHLRQSHHYTHQLDSTQINSPTPNDNCFYYHNLNPYTYEMLNDHSVDRKLFGTTLTSQNCDAKLADDTEDVSCCQENKTTKRKSSNHQPNTDLNHFKSVSGETLKGKKILSPKEMERKRDLANKQERRRMHRLNDALNRLRQIIPNDLSSNQRRLSKIKTLQSAINYIRGLQELLKE